MYVYINLIICFWVFVNQSTANSFIHNYTGNYKLFHTQLIISDLLLTTYIILCISTLKQSLWIIKQVEIYYKNNNVLMYVHRYVLTVHNYIIMYNIIVNKQFLRPLLPHKYVCLPKGNNYIHVIPNKLNKFATLWNVVKQFINMMLVAKSILKETKLIAKILIYPSKSLNGVCKCVAHQL